MKLANTDDSGETLLKIDVDQPAERRPTEPEPLALWLADSKVFAEYIAARAALP